MAPIGDGHPDYQVPTTADFAFRNLVKFGDNNG